MEIDVVLVLARWLHFASLMIVFGTSLFPLYALPRSIGDTAMPALAKADRSIRLASYLALASGSVWVTRSITMMADGPAGLVDSDALWAFFLQTGFGPVWLLRLVLLVVLAVLVDPRWAKRNPSAWRALVAVLAGAALASQAWLGHAAMASGAGLVAQLGSYMAHVIAAGAWIGGLLPLGYILADQARRGRDGLIASCTILVRFSRLGVVAVSLILVSGIANTAFRLTSIGDLVGTDYGLAILGKALLFSVMLAVAALNRWQLMPQTGGGNLRALAALRRNVLIELVLAGLIIGGAAILGTLPP